MRTRLCKTSLPWILFAAAFLIPQLFLLFMPYAVHIAYRALFDEYSEVFEYWGAGFQSLKLKSGSRRPARLKQGYIKAAAEMV